MLGFNKKEKKKGLNHNQTDLLCLSLLAVSVTIARVSCLPFSHVICICDMTVRFRHIYCFYKKLGKVKSFIYLLDMTHAQRATTYIQITNYMIWRFRFCTLNPFPSKQWNEKEKKNPLHNKWNRISFSLWVSFPTHFYHTKLIPASKTQLGFLLLHITVLSTFVICFCFGYIHTTKGNTVQVVVIYHARLTSQPANASHTHTHFTSNQRYKMPTTITHCVTRFSPRQHDKSNMHWFVGLVSC